jgi:hypothetical protein
LRKEAFAASYCRPSSVPPSFSPRNIQTQERQRKRGEQVQRLREAQAELGRLLAEEESLQRVVRGQERMLARLADG